MSSDPETDGGPSLADIRQRHHQRRSRRTRWVARLLIPVLMLSISAALWSDPKIAAKLREGHQVSLSMAQDWLGGTEVDSPPETAPTPVEENRPTVRRLPQDRVRVRRPGGG